MPKKKTGKTGNLKIFFVYSNDFNCRNLRKITKTLKKH